MTGGTSLSRVSNRANGFSACMGDRIHIWNHCHACGAQPIVGPRFECESCPAGADNDLCESCYREWESGAIVHPAPQSYAAKIGVNAHAFRAFAGRASDLYEEWLAVPRAVAASPDVPDRFVVRTEFRSWRDVFSGAYAFVVESEPSGAPLVLTALRVMDEVIKIKRIDHTALPAVVQEVRLYDAFASSWALAELGAARSMLALRDARLGDEAPYSDRDIAAFRAGPAADVAPARLAMEPPRVGDPIWLAVNRGRKADSRVIEATVVESTERTLVFRFTHAADVALHSSGAPLIDRDGNVAGINVGAGTFGGERFGHANHVASVRRHLGMQASSLTA
jgi:hypothetical protein